MKIPHWFKNEKVIAAIIGLIGVLVVGYWQFILKPRASTEETFQYIVHVEDLSTGEVIAGAEVIIEVIGKVPLNAISDSYGTARFIIDDERVGQPGRIRIEVTGYKAYRENIDLIEDILPDIVQLEKVP